MPDGKITLKIEAKVKEALQNLKIIEKNIKELQRVYDSLYKQYEKATEKAAASHAEVVSAQERQASLQEALEKKREARLEEVIKLEKERASLINKQASAADIRADLQKGLQDGLASGKLSGADETKIRHQIEQYDKIINDLEKQIADKAREIEVTKKGTAQQTKEEIKLEQEIERQKQKTSSLEKKEQGDLAKVKQLTDDVLNARGKLRREKEKYSQQNTGLTELHNFGQLNKVVLGVGYAFGKAAKGAIKLGKAITIDPMVHGFKKLVKGITNFGKRLKFVILQGLLFRNMRKYLSEFAQSMGNALKKNEQFSASLANLKGTFWASIAPVVDAVAPILARFLDMIAKLITYLSGLAGILFGIRKASKAAGAGLASAGQKGKEASNNLASWDTIQNLDSNSGADSGSGISPTFGQDFDEAYEKLEKFRELFEKGDWFDIGKYVGEELSKVIATIDNWITGTLAPKILEWANNIGSFINGFFVGMNWSNLGKTVGDAIVAIFNGISEFLDTVDWHKVGESVSEFLSGIDWETLLKSVGEAIVKAIIHAIEFAEGLTGINLEPFKKIFKELYDLFSDLIDLLSGNMTVQEWFEQLSGFQTILVIIAALVGLITVITTIISLVNTVITIIMVIKTVIMALITTTLGHVILIITAIIAIVVLLIKHWDDVKAKLLEIWNAFVQVWEDIKTMAKAVIDFVVDIFKGIWERWKHFTELVDKGVEELIKKITEGIKKFVEDVKAWWKNTVDSTKQFIEQIKGYINSFKEKVVSIIDKIKQKAQDVIDSIKNGIKSAINFIIRFINGLIGRVESAINFIISGLNKFQLPKIPDWVPVIGGKQFGFNIASVSIGRIPELAQGAVVNPSHEFAAILGDNRHEQEVVSPLSTMKQAFLDALAEYSGNTEVVLEVDGRKFATALVPHINNRSRAYGTSVIL